MERLARSITVLAGALAVPVAAWAQQPAWDGSSMHPMWGAWGISMMVVMLAFWALVIAAIVLGVRWLVTDRRLSVPDRPLAILRERYARGEINKDEFEARRRDLEAA
jgi:putative membrane protein